jgi:protein-glutamine gamma-glutamyltransferase
MSQAPQLDAIPLAAAINQYFEISLYLLTLMGFGCLASTGSLDLPSILLVSGALAIRGYLLAKRQHLAISESWTTPLTLAYFAFYAADYFLLSRAFLSATVHLVMFAVVIRVFSLRRDRDHITLAILAFLMVLASAVLTVDSVFLLFFAGFLLMAVVTFILMEMRRSGRDAKFQARHSSDAHEHWHLAFSLARLTPVLMLMILIAGGAMFFLLPRVSSGYLGSYSLSNDLSTGFSDRVQLGRIGQIQQSKAVVMHIKIDGDNEGRYDLHWRGVSLAFFDGKTWSNPRQQYVLPREPGGAFDVPTFGQGVAPARPGESLLLKVPAKFIHYHVLTEPIGTNVFFLAPWVHRVSGTYRMLASDSGGAIFDLDGQRAVGMYEADSDIASPSPEQLRAASSEIPAFAFAYLQLPTVDSRIPQLAAKISSSASNNYDKAIAVERYLKSQYAYTLQLPRTTVADPVANFLFERKQGHCEYFAASMAVMLRTLRVPSRVVNGFRSDEFNDVTGSYVVRAQDAHSWVEAYFPEYGWVTFDPTPAGVTGTPQGWGRVMLYMDAAASFWREWVVSYDSSHQNVLGQTALTGTRVSWERARTWSQLSYERMLSWTRLRQRDAEKAPTQWLIWIAAIAALLFSLANAGRFAKILRTRQLLAHPERSPHQAAAMWYERMVRHMARRGLPKSTNRTAQEFVRDIKDEQLRARVSKFTEAYEAARFGDSSDDAVRLPELYEEVEAAAKN